MVNKKLFLLFVILSAVFFSFTGIVAADTPDIEEGNWIIEVKMSVQGAELPPQTYTNCLKKENAVPFDQDPQSQECKPQNVKTSGNTVTWTMDCKGMTGKGAITYSGDSMEGKIIINTAQGEMIQHLKGKRIGPCTE